MAVHLRETTPGGRPISLYNADPFAMVHTRAVQSFEAVANFSPLGLNTTATTGPL